MSAKNRILRYAKENFGEVLHTTLNPEGPGVVRIHLVPPKYDEEGIGPSVAIINGQDIIPVNVSWSILLAEFIKEVNQFSGKPLTDEDVDGIITRTAKGMRKVYPLLGKKTVHDDLFRIMKSFRQIASGEAPDEDIQYLNLGDYAPYMRAPHRMDLLVSAMTKDGAWNCSQKCVHCYAAGQELAEEKELSTEEWKTILDRCREAGVPQVTFTGGEPTMRKDLPELIAHAKWFVSRLNTNGVALTPEYCQELRKSALDSMQITFYSCDPAVHNELVGAEKYEYTLAGIKNALAAGLNVSINTPLCTLNRDYLKTLEFLRGLGIIYVTCSSLIVTGNARKDPSKKLQLSVEELKDILRESVDYAYSNGMEISFTSPGWVDSSFCEELGINAPTCGACLSNMAITPAGNVVPCQSWLSGEPLGNMLTDNWEDIWNGAECVSRRDYSAKMLGECPLRTYTKVERSVDEE
jgi:MoaA/NifB/PqqE/SkfB family radical SAM enzyme